MSQKYNLVSILSLVLLSSCDGGSSSSPNDKVVVEAPPAPPAPPALTKFYSKAFYATKNEDGTYSSSISTWQVPPHVKHVKVIGCSGGNGGGGGGAGGGGATFYKGNWGKNTYGGSGSAGGSANGIEGSGEGGEAGLTSRVCTYYNGCRYANRDHIAYSASQPGINGEIGEISSFGNNLFKKAIENTNNIDNIRLVTNYLENPQVCLGGTGGTGGSGGNGYIDDSLSESSDSFYGGKGGHGGNGSTGLNAIVEIKNIDVTPGQKIEIKVGKGGNGGAGSSAVGAGLGEHNTHNAVRRGQDGSPGSNGNTGSPGVIYIEWIGE